MGVSLQNITNKDTQTNKQRDRQTNRQTERREKRQNTVKERVNKERDAKGAGRAQTYRAEKARKPEKIAHIFKIEN